MKTIKFIGQLVVVLGVIAYVRISRAVEAALWEICPEVVTGFRNIADSAHSDVCAAQRHAIAQRRGEPTPVVPAFAAALTPPAPEPAAGRFRSPRAWDAACKAYLAKANKLLDARTAAAYGSPEWDALDRQLERNREEWRRCHEGQPTLADYRREREELAAL
jgi:hypothetical protein